MVTPLDNQKGENYFQIKGNSSFLTNKFGDKGQSAEVSFGEELSSALSSLSQLDNSDKLREDAIKNGKAIIENWQPPSDTQIDEIMQKLSDKL